MYSDLTSLYVPLPEDIQKLKWYGDFDRAIKVINMRLKKEIPAVLKTRLELEKEILKRMPLQYPYSYEEALQLMKKAIRDFKEDELEELRDEDAAEWIYVNGQIRFKDDFLANLVKTRKYLADRVNDPEMTRMKLANFELLDMVIGKMKDNKSLEYYFRIRTTLRIQPGAEREGEFIRVHLPIPIEYAQVKQFKLISTSMEPVCIAPADYPQRTVCFETKLSKGQEFSVEYEFVNHMAYVEPKPEAAMDAQPVFYTEEQPPHVMFTPYMKAFVKEVIGNETNAVKKARMIYDYITTHVMYSYVRSYFTITDISGYMATGFKGDCGIQALFFITMCRCAGIPARWQAGLYSTPLDIGNHDWAQFYIDPYGWLYADCSFGGAAYREGALDRWNFYFGNLEPFRVPANSDFQHEFTPGKCWIRNDPYDNQNGEAEYEDRGLLSEEYETVHEVIEVREL